MLRTESIRCSSGAENDQYRQAGRTRGPFHMTSIPGFRDRRENTMRNRAAFFVVCGLMVLTAFAATAAGADSVVVVTTQAAQGANDFVRWAQLGGDSTPLGATFNATSAQGGVSVAGTLAGANSLAAAVCPAVQCSWNSATFSSGDSVIWTSDAGNSGNGPLTLVFGTSITGVGALIQANAPGQFTAQIQAFNGANVLGTFPVTSDAAGDAVYIGVQDQTAPNITKVVFSITACAPVDSSGCTDFAIGTLNLNQGAGVASFSPRSLSFGVVPIGTTSPQGTVTLINTGGAFLQVSALAVAGGNSGDFNLSQSCPASLGPGASCALNVTFKPTGAGPRKASIAVGSGAAGNAPAIILTGVGSAGGPSPTSLTFTSQTVGTSSLVQVVTFTNSGSATMNLWQIAILGANAGDFSKTTTCGSTLGAGANCTVSVTFKPTATGARAASLLFSDDGGGSPQAVSLSGTGS